MSPKVAFIIYLFLLIWILRIERKQNPEPSLSVWIPTLFFMIMASRPLGRWFTPVSSGGNVAEGSTFDQWVLSCLIILAVLLLYIRRVNWSLFIKENRWLIFFYVFLGVSIFWSEYPFSSFKRWTKIFGIVIMGFIILSERKPLKALESMLRRSAYILIPLSVVFIKYFPQFGVSYTTYSGIPMGTGVCTHKNSLGILCSVLTFFLIWRIFIKWRSGKLSISRLYILADGVVICLGLFLLFGGGATYSATAILIFVIGTAWLVVLYRYRNMTEYLSKHFKIVLIAMVVSFMLFYSTLLPTVTSLLDRREDLTYRDRIWSSVLDIASRNPILGTGYGGYWGLAADSSGHRGVNQSHNGYIEVYLQVGVAGIMFLIIFIFKFCGNIRQEIEHTYDWGLFGMCFLLMMLLYNYSEASFISGNLTWSLMVILSIVFSNSNSR